MALPFLKKRRKKKNTSSKNTKTTKKTSALGKVGKLAGVLANYTVAKPLKFAGNVAMSGIAKEFPQITLLTNTLSDLISDVKHAFGKKTDENKETPSKPANDIASLKSSIDNIAKIMVNQTKILSNDLAKINISLNRLDDITGELRTLSSLTAKVWDVENKVLHDTRSRNRKMAETNFKKRFSDEISKTDNQSYKENLDSLEPKDVSPIKEEKEKPNMFKRLLNSVSSISKLPSKIGNGISAVGNGMLSMGQGIGKFLMTIGEEAVPILGGVIVAGLGIFLAKNFDKIKKGLSAVWNKIEDYISEKWKKFNTTMEKFNKSFHDTIMYIPNKIKEAFSEAIDFIMDKWNKLKNMLPEWVQKKMGIDVEVKQTSSTISPETAKNPIAVKKDETVAKTPIKSVAGASYVPKINISAIPTENIATQKLAENQKISQHYEAMNKNSATLNSHVMPVIAPTANNTSNNTNILINNGFTWREDQIKRICKIDTP